MNSSLLGDSLYSRYVRAKSIYGARRLVTMSGLVLLLTGCAALEESCILDVQRNTVSRQFQEALPVGCQVVESGSIVSQISCADGRVGYAFSSPSALAPTTTE